LVADYIAGTGLPLQHWLVADKGSPIVSASICMRDGSRRRLAFTMATTAGYATFGVLAFHLAHRQVLPLAAIPVV